MIAQEIYRYQCEFEVALDSGDLDSIRQVSEKCNLFLTSHLPLHGSEKEDLVSITDSLESLLSVYQSALSMVNSAKNKVGKELQSIGRNKIGASQYRDVARSFKP